MGLSLAISLAVAVTPAAAAKSMLGWYGTPTGAAGIPGVGFQQPGSVAINDPTVDDLTTDPFGNSTEGHTYVVDRTGNAVHVLGENRKFIYAFGNGVNQTSAASKICPRPGNLADVCKVGTTNAERGGFNQPFAVSIDQEDGSIYVVDKNNFRIQKFSASGEFLYMIGKGVNQTDATARICPRSGNPADVCKIGVLGTKGGEFGQQGESLIEVDRTTRNLVVADRGNRRLQEFAPDGSFIRAFGWDVVANGKPEDLNTNEIQKVTIAAGGGTFVLRHGTAVTAALPYNATAGQVKTALEAISGLKGVTVTGGPGGPGGANPYYVEFTGEQAGANTNQLTIDTTSKLTPAVGAVLKCVQSLFDREVTGYKWLRNGNVIPGENQSTYTVQAADEGKPIQCLMKGLYTDESDLTFLQAIGISYATVISPAPTPLPPSVPTNIWGSVSTSKPVQVGGPGGNPMDCGSSTAYPGATSNEWAWYMDGEEIVGATEQTYVTKPSDHFEPHNLQCVRFGINESGRTAYISNPYVWPSATAAAGFMYASIPDETGATTVEQEGGTLEICTIPDDCKESAGVNTGQQVGQFGQFQQLNSIATDGDGGSYILETFGTNTRVVKFFTDGGVQKAELWGPTFSAISDRPLYLRSSPDGNFFYAWNRPNPDVCPDGSPGSVSLPGNAEMTIKEADEDGNIIAEHGVCARNSSVADIQLHPGTGDIVVAVTNSDQGNRLAFLNTDTPPISEITSLAPVGLNLGVSHKVNPNTIAGYPNSRPAFYEVEYRMQGATGWTKLTPALELGTGTTPFERREMIPDGRAKTTYEVRIKAAKRASMETGYSPTVTVLNNPAPPAIVGTSTSEVSASAAKLHATIDARGTDTTYYFEWGETVEYGNTTPVTDIGDGFGGQAVVDAIGDLVGGTYHFRVVAENAHGTVHSKNQTFNFYPEKCPNELVRQQTKSQFLPDCRAYELVSPRSNGGMLIFPSNGNTTGLANGPARISWTGTFGIAPGADGVSNTYGDHYVSTRGDSQWESKYVGLDVTETVLSGARPGKAPPTSGGVSTSIQISAMQRDILVNEDMSVFGVWNRGNQGVAGNSSWSNAPYLLSPSGDRLGRFPTNVAEIPGGEQFLGDMTTSADLSHFVFSSDIPFHPDGQVGDIYDNDVNAGTVVPISRKENGDAFAGSAVAASRDGSRILMYGAPIPVCAAKANCPAIPAAPLYMRMDGETFDVSGGHSVKFGGMSSDGSVVYFTSAAQITLDDTDTSTDIYVWRASAPEEIVRVSAGIEGTGNRDDCISVEAWAEKCAASTISTWSNSCGEISSAPCTEYPRFFGTYTWSPGGRGGNGRDDQFIASANGDLYFVSPETLLGESQGLANQMNLYLYREGTLRHVARFLPDVDCIQMGTNKGCSEKGVMRMQVTPDGKYMAFVTKSPLTTNPTGGHPTMYRYDVLADQIECVSCPADGSAPTERVLGSVNGRFISDDGRTFFTSEDSLVPRDTNGDRDVYEFVDGRAQMVSQGVSPSQMTVGGFIGRETIDALIGVSRNGIDVFFATTDSLVPEDDNGATMKIYDARVNGGFRFDAPAGKCEAADECRGDASTRPETPVQGTGVDLGERGNYVDESSSRCATLSKKARSLRNQANAASKAAKRNPKKATRQKAKKLNKQANKAAKQAKNCSAKASRAATRTEVGR